MLQSPSRETTLDAYADIFGAPTIERIRDLARPLQGARILHLSLATSGTHHSRMLYAAVPLLANLGLNVGWKSPRLSDPDRLWSDVLHRAIEGDAAVWSSASNEAWRRFTWRQASIADGSYDLVVVHDPQLLRLRDESGKTHGGTKWVWHCHFDLRDCDEKVASLLTAAIAGFDQVAIEHPAFAGTIAMPVKTVIPAVIDPLSRRNAQLPPRVIDAVLKRFDLKPEWPLAVEVSPFDGWDDPQWAFWVYEAARKEVPNLQLTLAATSESAQDVFSSIRGRCNGNVRLLSCRMAGDVEINALQGKAVVAMQNAVRKGFSTSLLEASWKGRPVLASDGGAMSHQVEHGTTGYLFANFDEAAERIVQLVNDPNMADAVGFNGHRSVRENHLVVRWVEAYLGLLSRSRQSVA